MPYIGNIPANTFSTPVYPCGDNFKRDSFLMKLQGRGTIRRQPDIAYLILAVVTENLELSKAQQTNSDTMKNVINALKSSGIAEKDIQTSFYTVEPLYDYEEGKQIFKGYRVSNGLKVTVRDIEKTGRIIDTAVENGANQVRGINFTLSDIDKYYRKALQLALEDSMQKAVALVESMGVRLMRVPVSITEENYNVPIPQNQGAFKLTAGSTPVEAGEIEVTASITAVYQYIS